MFSKKQKGKAKAAAKPKAASPKAKGRALPKSDEQPLPNKRRKVSEKDEPPSSDAADAVAIKNDVMAEVVAASTGDIKDGSSSNSTFEEHLFELILFKTKTGNFQVKAGSQQGEFAELARWITRIRKHYRMYQRGEACDLNADRVKVLEAIGFQLSVRGDEHWTRNFDRIKDYKEKHGHCMVPRLSESQGLGDWVINQRLQYKQFKQGKSTTMTEKRVGMLNDIGFVWQIRNRPEWGQKFQELEAYFKKNGDTRVPQHFPANKALGKWVAKQREQYKFLKKGKHSFLTPDRLEKLNEIGFVWSVRAGVIVDEAEMAEMNGDSKPPAEEKGGVAKAEASTVDV